MATDSRGIQALSDAIDLHQKLGISTHRKEQLLAEKAYRLIQRNRMKNVGIEALKQEISNEIQAGTFNLYRFAKKHY
jgi:LAO/AO transport system kinase